MTSVCAKQVLMGCLLILVCGGCGTIQKRDAISITSESYWLQEAAIPKRVAVLTFTGEKLRDGLVSAGGQAITDVVVKNLLQGGFVVLERDHFQDVLLEHGLIKGGEIDASDTEKARVLGRVLNADAIITGKLLRKSVPHAQRAGSKDKLAFLSGGVEMAARAIDVKTGQILWMCTLNVIVESKTGKIVRYPDYLNEACAELVFSLKNPNYVNKKNASFVKETKIKELRESRQM